ncbi:MAG: hypothetical protein H6670_17520 [Anaerolineaceae bacterium]|nr:hypothetical protein [Anaerolineae bacterium]MCB9461457.1 hypothetical protein [Anaerolineaceae bacterium]
MTVDENLIHEFKDALSSGHFDYGLTLIEKHDLFTLRLLWQSRTKPDAAIDDQLLAHFIYENDWTILANKLHQWVHVNTFLGIVFLIIGILVLAWGIYAIYGHFSGTGYAPTECCFAPQSSLFFFMSYLSLSSRQATLRRVKPRKIKK